MIVLDHLSKRYGDSTVVDDVSLRVDRGTILVIVGTSGSGKSTLLRMINRLVEPSAGRVLIEGRDTAAEAARLLRRRIGYAIQSHGLFPHRSVADNIATVPRLLHWEPGRIQRRVRDLLEAFQLDPALYADKFPHQLSGGQQQRVGVARALAAEPAVLLMDEPFGALDPIIRAKAQDDLLAIQRKFSTTVVLVTHDMDEAFRLGDRVAVMSQGRLLQCDRPAQLLTHPADALVAKMTGSADRALRLLSLTRAGDEKTGNPIQFVWKNVTNLKADGNKITGDVVQFDPVYFKWMSFLTGYVLPRAYYEKVGAEGFEKAPIGTGPYMVDKFEQNAFLRLKANPNYWGGKPAFEAVTIKFVPDAASRVAEIESGSSQVTLEIPYEEYDRLIAKDGLAGSCETVSDIGMIFFNDKEAMLDANVRKAAVMAVDKKLLVDKLLRGYGLPIDTLETPEYAAFDPSIKVEHNPDKAKELLAASGFSPDKPVKFTIQTTKGFKPKRLMPDTTTATCGRSASMPVLTAPMERSAATLSICAAMKSGSISSTPVTPWVFWAVNAVMTLAP